MHKVINGDFPGGVDINTNLNANYHGYSTRQRTNIHILHTRTKLAIESFMRQGPIFWNTLPKEFIIISNIKQFRRKLKKYLLKGQDSG